MRIWSILLIKSDLKWCIHLRRSLFLYFNYLVSVKAGGPVCPRGRAHVAKFYGRLRLNHSVLRASKFSVLKFNSLRATTVHILDNAMVPTRHIISVTGHRAESSLKTYTGKTTDKMKKMMSHTLTAKTMIEDIPLNEITNIPPLVQSVSTMPVIPVTEDSDIMMNDGWDSVLARMPMPALPTFHNCTNVTINFNFQITK